MRNFSNRFKCSIMIEFPSMLAAGVVSNRSTTVTKYHAFFSECIDDQIQTDVNILHTDCSKAFDRIDHGLLLLRKLVIVI